MANNPLKHICDEKEATHNKIIPIEPGGPCNRMPAWRLFSPAIVLAARLFGTGFRLEHGRIEYK